MSTQNPMGYLLMCLMGNAPADNMCPSFLALPLAALVVFPTFFLALYMLAHMLFTKEIVVNQEPTKRSFRLFLRSFFAISFARSGDKSYEM
jgi:hypothetical protein